MEAVRPKSRSVNHFRDANVTKDVTHARAHADPHGVCATTAQTPAQGARWTMNASATPALVSVVPSKVPVP
jgi:hypothetical protein